VTLYLAEDDVRNLLSVDLAIEAVAAAHRAHGAGRAIDIPRARTRTPTAVLHILQGALLDEGVMGYKAYSTSRAGKRFLLHLFDASNGAPMAVIEADFLGMMRTGAAGGVAAKLLSRPESSVAGVFGAGWQAQSQIEALCHVRPMRRIKVWSRNDERRRAFCAEMTRRTGVDVVPAAGAEDAVRGSDIVVTITSAAEPLFDGDWLEAGTHVTAAGSNALIRKEIDEKTVRRADVICVDSRPIALREAGDLLPSLERGRIHEGSLTELGEILQGTHSGRLQPGQITLFESHGMAIQDLAVGVRIVALARQQGLGKSLPY
jgi:ornithine cyclodeaminase